MFNKIHQIFHFVYHFLKAKRKGHGVHSPYAYKLCEEVFYNNNPFYDFIRFAKTKKELLNDETILTVVDMGAGSNTFKNNRRKIKTIVSIGISSQKQSQILYRLINFLQIKNAIELGTSIGLNSMYMAAAAPKSKIISIEGDSQLFNFARDLSKKNEITNIEFVNARFDDVLPYLLSEIEELDLIYIDGNHTYDATLKYYEMAKTKRHNTSVFIFDDIYWSAGMTASWKKIQQDNAVTMTIDLFYFGMVFFNPQIKEKVNLRLYI